MINEYSFEKFIMTCCEMPEYELRDFIKNTLKEHGFSFVEDNYVSERKGLYKKIPNLLAVRGKPNVCLVAHTDVCRDHSGHSRKPEPTIKTKYHYGEKEIIIQDKNCKVQLGGDDRLGVAINLWVAINSGYDLGLLFTTDEEIGAISASALEIPMHHFDILLQVDRGNHRNQLVTSIGGVQLCSEKTAERLLDIAEFIDLPRVPVQGLLTDVYAIKKMGKCKNAVNMKYVAEIIKDYYLYGNTEDDIIDNEYIFAEEDLEEISPFTNETTIFEETLYQIR
jgi:hypothetical protein